MSPVPTAGLMRHNRFTFDTIAARCGYRHSAMPPIVQGHGDPRTPRFAEARGACANIMTENPSPQEMIRANAEMVLASARDDLGQDIGYDADGVRWLDGFIQRRHDGGGVGDDPSGLTNTLGSFLGECIVQSYNGRWQETEHGWAVIVDGDLAVFPFNKVHKHLAEGAADSVLSLYKGVPALIANTTAAGTDAPIAAAAEPPKSIVGKLGSLFRRR
jgi:hypothetical protein